MHIKKCNGIEFHYIAPDSNLDEILSAIKYLKKQIEEIDSYPDKSLFFQNPLIIEGWLALVRAIESNTVRDFPDTFEGLDEWSKRTEPFLSFLLSMRELHMNYQNLYKSYYNQLKELLDGYGGWIVGECISAEGIEALIADKYEQKLEGVDDINQYLTQLNSNSLNARSAVFSTLSDVFNILMAVMNRGGQIVIDYNPTIEAFAIAIDYDLREWTSHFGKSMFKRMKEDLHRHFNQRLTDNNRYDLWNEMLRADEKALVMASKQQLATCEDELQEHWGEDRKALMDENGKLMHLIYSSCYTEELFNMNKVDDLHQFITLLKNDNLDLFYEIIVRRNLIQCEMFPELKKEHEEWLNEDNEQLCEGEETNEELNYEGPKINLQRLLKQGWFNDVCVDSKYDATWTDSFISALMSSEWKDGIAKDWAISSAKNKRYKIRGYVVGLLKDNGVIKGSYDSIAKKIGIMNQSRNFSNYMSQGKKQPYADWVREYITGAETAE